MMYVPILNTLDILLQNETVLAEVSSLLTRLVNIIILNHFFRSKMIIVTLRVTVMFKGHQLFSVHKNGFATNVLLR